MINRMMPMRQRVIATIMLAVVLALVVARNGTAASPALATPQSLELTALNVGTYAGPVRTVLLANSARQWVREGEQYDESTPKEFDYLVANGFEDGVLEGFHGTQREGVYDGEVYMTAAGAARETRRSSPTAQSTTNKEG